MAMMIRLLLLSCVFLLCSLSTAAAQARSCTDLANQEGLGGEAIAALADDLLERMLASPEFQNAADIRLAPRLIVMNRDWRTQAVVADDLYLHIMTRVLESGSVRVFAETPTTVTNPNSMLVWVGCEGPSSGGSFQMSMRLTSAYPGVGVIWEYGAGL